MLLIYNAVLFVLTLIGGSMPMWSKGWSEQRMKYLLAFSGAFLLSITFMHLMPESISHLGSTSGILFVAGFFSQQFFQKYTHGMEHGHVHKNAGHKMPIWPVLIGLSIHAFSEGLPLGVSYSEQIVLPSLFLAIALHKLPEAMLIVSLLYTKNNNQKHTWLILALFSLITPFSSILSFYLGNKFDFIQLLIEWSIPLIAGVFIHIGTTIFFESGTKTHEMTSKKWLIIFLGVGLAMMSLIGGHNH